MPYLKQFYIAGSTLVILILLTVVLSSFTTASQTFTVKSTTPPGKIVLIPLTNSLAGTQPATTQSLEEEVEEVTAESISENTAAENPSPKTTPVNSSPVVKSASAAESSIINCSGTLPDKFLCLLNEYRAVNGKTILNGSGSLSKVALNHSSWMSQTGIFSHTGENNSRLGDRCKLVGIQCRAENLAQNIYSADKLIEMWKNSPSHNQNLLGSYSSAGLGISGDYITLLLN